MSTVPPSRFRRPVLVSALVAVGFAATGCAIKYQDADGRLHVVGLVATTLTPPNPAAPTRVETANLGLMLYATDASRGLSAGYNRETVHYTAPVAAAVPPARAPLSPAP